MAEVGGRRMVIVLPHAVVFQSNKNLGKWLHGHFAVG